MSDAAVATQSPVQAKPAKGSKATKVTKKAAAKTGGSKAKVSKPTHPPTAQMVNSAITTLKERGGSSLHAIKKYITSTYKVDAEKLSPFIRKYIKSAVSSGGLVQTKGHGASGSFKLPGPGGETGAKKKVAAKKPAAKKSKTAKKAASTTKTATASSAAKIKATKKPPTTPKAPKPKKAKATPKAAKKPAAKTAKKATKKASPKKK